MMASQSALSFLRTKTLSTSPLLFQLLPEPDMTKSTAKEQLYLEETYLRTPVQISVTSLRLLIWELMTSLVFLRSASPEFEMWPE